MLFQFYFLKLRHLMTDTLNYLYCCYSTCTSDIEERRTSSCLEREGVSIVKSIPGCSNNCNAEDYRSKLDQHITISFPDQLSISLDFGSLNLVQTSIVLILLWRIMARALPLLDKLLRLVAQLIPHAYARSLSLIEWLKWFNLLNWLSLELIRNMKLSLLHVLYSSIIYV